VGNPPGTAPGGDMTREAAQALQRQNQQAGVDDAVYETMVQVGHD
jgi:hypothetical protein